MSYLVTLALNDTVLPAALLFLAPHRLTTHSYHILPELYTGPLLAAFLWLPLNFVLFYSTITVLGVALSCLALSQGVASDPQQTRLLVCQSIVAGVLSVLYAATRARIWAAVSSAASRGRRRRQKALEWDPSLEPHQLASLLRPGSLGDAPQTPLNQTPPGRLADLGILTQPTDEDCDGAEDRSVVQTARVSGARGRCGGADTVAASSAKAAHQMGGCPAAAAAAAAAAAGVLTGVGSGASRGARASQGALACAAVAALPGASSTENGQLLATATSEESLDRRRRRHDAATALCSLELTHETGQEADATACSRSSLRPHVQVESSHGRGNSGGAAPVGAGSDDDSAGTGSDRSACGAQAFWATGWQQLSCDSASCRCGPGCTCGCGCSGAGDSCCQGSCNCDGLRANCAIAASAAAYSSPTPALAARPHTAQRSAVAGSPAAVQSLPSAPVRVPSIPAYEGFWLGHGGYGPLIGGGALGGSAHTCAVPASHTGVAAAPPSASSRPQHPCSTNMIRTSAMAAAADWAAHPAAGTAPPGSLPPPSEPAGVPNVSACPQSLEPPTCAGADAGAAFGAATVSEAVSSVAAMSPMEHARALIAAAALCEYQGSMVLRRVVIRLPAPWANGLTPAWSENLHEELHKRHPDWHLLNTFVHGSTIPGSGIDCSGNGSNGSDRGSNSGGGGSSRGDRGSSSDSSRSSATCDGGSGGVAVAGGSDRST